jgi:hypothetical protein
MAKKRKKATRKKATRKKATRKKKAAPRKKKAARCAGSVTDKKSGKKRQCKAKAVGGSRFCATHKKKK